MPLNIPEQVMEQEDIYVDDSTNIMLDDDYYDDEPSAYDLQGFVLDD